MRRLNNFLNNSLDVQNKKWTFKDFLEKNPKVKKFLEAASIPLADISAQNLKMYKGEKSEADVKRHAQEWIKANQSTFDSWIEKAQN